MRRVGHLRWDLLGPSGPHHMSHLEPRARARESSRTSSRIDMWGDPRGGTPDGWVLRPRSCLWVTLVPRVGTHWRAPPSASPSGTHEGDPPLDVRGFHEGILTYHTMTHRYKEENER